MTAQSVEIQVVTVVWGHWHLSAFLDMNLPTLLAPGNFPTLFEKHRGSYRVYTRAADVSHIQSAAAFQQLAALMPVNLEIIEDEDRLKNPIETHIEIWRDAVAEATLMRQLALLMPPDVLWSDGSFAYVAELLSQGKRGIYASFARVTSNSFIPAFRDQFGAHPDQIALSGADLVTLSLEHLHPIMAAYSRASRYFPFHTEMAVWPVANEGLAVRVFARELLIYDPSRIRLNANQLITGRVSWDELHMVSNSDDLFGVSLTPLGKDAGWHRMRWQVTTRDVARWWLEYDSLANDFVSAVRVRWHFGPVTESLWRQREFGADLFTRRAALESEAMRVIRHIFGDPTGRAVQIGRLLALLVISGKLARAVRGMPRLQTHAIFVFVPEDEALGDELLAACVALVAATDGRAERMLRDHVAIAPEDLDLSRIDELEAVDVDFSSGVRRRLTHAKRTWMIDGVAISTMERASAMMVVCYTRGMLSARQS